LFLLKLAQPFYHLAAFNISKNGAHAFGLITFAQKALVVRMLSLRLSENTTLLVNRLIQGQMSISMTNPGPNFQL
jgi:hypothetical protein